MNKKPVIEQRLKDDKTVILAKMNNLSIRGSSNSTSTNMTDGNGRFEEYNIDEEAKQYSTDCRHCNKSNRFNLVTIRRSDSLGSFENVPTQSDQFTEYDRRTKSYRSGKFRTGRDSRRNYITSKYTEVWKNYATTKRSISHRNIRDATDGPSAVDNNCSSSIGLYNKVDNSELETLRNETLAFTKASRDTFQRMLSKCDRTLRRRTSDALNDVRDNADKTNDYEKFWQRITQMEIRAQERKRRWDTIRENKKRLEEEKLKELERKKAEEMRKIRREKKEKLLELERKKLKEEQTKKRQLEEREHIRKMNDIADEYRRRKLLAGGLKNLHQLLLHRRRLVDKADLFYKRRLLSKCFSKITIHRQLTIDAKIEKANEIYDRTILKKYFDRFKRVFTQYQQNLQVANNMYNFKLLKDSYYTWKLFIHKKRYEEKLKEREMDMYYNRKLLNRCFQKWTNYKRILFKEREKEKRLRTWRSKVQEELPDFEV